jgi:hypothetical protein
MKDRMTLTPEGYTRIQATYEGKLLHLIEILEEVENLNSFNMNGWWRETNINESECGFAACAAGWAAMDPVFNELGLGLDPTGLPSKGVRYEIGGNLFRGFSATSEFFGLTSSESMYIFDPCSYSKQGKITPQRVINHIKEVMKEWENR